MITRTRSRNAGRAAHPAPDDAISRFPQVDFYRYVGKPPPTYLLMLRIASFSCLADSVVLTRKTFSLFCSAYFLSKCRFETYCKISSRSFSIRISEKVIGKSALAATSTQRFLNSPVPFTIKVWFLNFALAINKAACTPASVTSRFNELSRSNLPDNTTLHKMHFRYY